MLDTSFSMIIRLLPENHQAEQKHNPADCVVDERGYRADWDAYDAA
jgi:hypothetical protein